NSSLVEGSWGILRVLGGGVADGGPPRLPGHGAAPGPVTPASSVCPDAAPRRSFSVAARDAALPMLEGETGRVYALATDTAGATGPPTPFVAHANVGDCIVVDLANQTAGPVGFHA